MANYEIVEFIAIMQHLSEKKITICKTPLENKENKRNLGLHFSSLKDFEF